MVTCQAGCDNQVARNSCDSFWGTVQSSIETTRHRLNGLSSILIEPHLRYQRREQSFFLHRKSPQVHTHTCERELEQEMALSRRQPSPMEPDARYFFPRTNPKVQTHTCARELEPEMALSRQQLSSVEPVTICEFIQSERFLFPKIM